MCGICGFISNREISLEQLKAMNDTMYHRGPDDSGQEIYSYANGYSVGLAQRRLAIMDLSPLGHQPMHAANDQVTIVYNGEIYNHLELKKELGDYPFKSTCDTEVILAAYLKWGIDCVQRLNGMFAIALFDKRTDDIYLIRDRIGKKPLYYWLDGANLVFGSELKPILKCNEFKREIRQDVLARYLFQQYINAPDTIFENVYKLEPGTILHYNKGKMEKTKYWDIRRVYDRESAKQVGSYQEAKAGLKQRLQTATRERMIADVPLGTFLSGGYDSSLVTALAQEASETPVKTFCVGFDDPSHNEAQFASQVAKHLGTDHTEVIISEKEMLDLVDSIPQYYDEPFADTSQIPTMLVSQIARKKVTVALSGDGGDEFFCGYRVYDRVKQAQQTDLLGKLLYGIGQLGPEDRKLIERYPRLVKAVVLNRDPKTKTQAVSDIYLQNARNFVLGNQQPILFPVEEEYPVRNWQVRRMLLDMDTYLPGDILAKVDRASMKYALENRCPILDVNVMEYSFRIPHRYKYKNGDKKHILKDLAYDYLPKELLDRPKKGFSVPMSDWLRGPLKDQLMAYSGTDFLRNQGIFDAKFVPQFINDFIMTGDAGAGTGMNFSNVVWSFFIFQQWCEYYGIHQ